MRSTLTAVVIGLYSILFSPLSAGNIKVIIAPSEAVTAGAQWRVDGGAWRNSRATASKLTDTTHVVSFKDLAGWLKPSPITVTLAGNTVTLNATYLRPASLTVNLSPTTGQWRVDGGAWKTAGSTATDLTPGSHSIEYLSLPGYTSPPPELMTLTAGQTKTVTRSYTPLAQISINLSPSAGQWRVDGGTWQTSGASVIGLAAGNHTVEYSNLAGYTSPANENIVLTTGQTLSLSRNYTAQTAQLTVTLTPAIGQWRVGGGTWQISGATVTDLAAGDHLVEYNGLANHNSPPPETITLTAGEGALLARSYVPLLYTAASTGVPGIYDYTGANAGGAHAINLEGAVTGGTFLHGQALGYIYTDGVVEETGNLGGPGVALKLNDRRVAVGFSWTSSPSAARHATRYENGSLQSIGEGGTALGVNFDGAIVGQSGAGSAFLHVDGAMFDLGKWGGQSAAAIDINDSDVIVGVATTSSSISQAVRYHDGQIEVIPGLGGTANRANAINNAGVIVGDGSPSGSSPRHAFRRDSGVTVDLGTLGGANSRALDLNDAGVIVGWAEVAANTPHAFVYREGTMLDLNGVARLPEGVVLTAATGINASGQIIANGSDGTAYILTPITNLGGVSVQLADGIGQWRVDGGSWQNTGSIAAELAAGPHTIEYVTVAGYAAPAPETIAVNGGGTTVIRRNYHPNPAQLTITVTPPSGQWRVNGGVWQSSGTILDNLASGIAHTVEFSAVEGYVIPSPLTVTLTGGEYRTLAVDYLQLATVYASINPPGIGVQWRLDGGDWQPSISPFTNLSFDVPHTVEFSDYTGYVTPPPQTFTLASGELRSVYANYAAQVASYTVADLGTLGGYRTFASAINLGGVVAGYSYTTGNAMHAFRYRDGSMEDLGTLGGTYSQAYGINDAGTIVGTSNTVEGTARGFRFKDGLMEILPTLGGTVNEAYAINNKGTIAGFSQIAGGATHGFRYRDGIMEDLGTLGGFVSIAMGLNESDTVIGMAMVQPTNFDYRAFLSGESGMQNLGSLGGNHSQANVINDAGVIVGSARLTDGSADHAFRYEGGTMSDLGTLEGGNSSSYAYGINNSGTIVGTSLGTVGSYQAFIYRNGVMENLNTLVDLPGVTLTEAIGPNDLGQIVANASNNRSYLLTPINSPGGLQITLDPATAFWRVDGGAWQTSGSPMLNLPIGTHTIEYSSVSERTSPPPETVTVSSGRLLQLNRSYTAIP